MLDFGFTELLFILMIAVLVIGPQDIPKLMVSLGRIVRRLQYVRYAVSQQFEDFMRENDLEDIRSSVNFEEGHVFDEAAEDAAFSETMPEQSEQGQEDDDERT